LETINQKKKRQFKVRQQKIRKKFYQRLHKFIQLVSNEEIDYMVDFRENLQRIRTENSELTDKQLEILKYKDLEVEYN